MTREEIYNRVIELEGIIRKLEAMNKQDELLKAIDEQMELAAEIGIEELG